MKTRVLALLALLASLAAPALAAAADVPLPPPPPGASLQPNGGWPSGYRLGVHGGFLSQGDVASACLQVDLSRSATPPKWTRFELEWHLPIRIARPKWDGIYMRTVTTGGGSSYEIPAGTTTDTVWVIEAIPTARLVLPVVKGFSVHAEAGVGLSQTVETHVEDQDFVGLITTRTLVIAPVLRGAIGVSYRISDRLDVVMQPVALGRRVGTSDSSFSALWGVSYKL